MISWEGRSPVEVVWISASTGEGLQRAQAALDDGLVVDVGEPGRHHVAGHFSSHGAVFRAGPNLVPGAEVRFDGAVYVVTGTESARAGDPPNWREGLTVQYSGCGGVCLVRTREL